MSRITGNYLYRFQGQVFRNKADAQRAAQREANRTGRRTEFYTFYRIGTSEGADLYAGEAYPKGQRNPARKRSNAPKFWTRRRIGKALKKYVRGNPARVQGRKVKGGRSVTVRNFTGTIVKKSDGTVQIVGRGKRK